MIKLKDVFDEEEIAKMTETQTKFVNHLIRKANKDGEDLEDFQKRVFWYRGRYFFEGPALKVDRYEYEETFKSLKKKGLASRSDNLGHDMLIY